MIFIGGKWVIIQSNWHTGPLARPTHMNGPVLSGMHRSCKRTCPIYHVSLLRIVSCAVFPLHGMTWPDLYLYFTYFLQQVVDCHSDVVPALRETMHKLYFGLQLFFTVTFTVDLLPDRQLHCWPFPLLCSHSLPLSCCSLSLAQAYTHYATLLWPTSGLQCFHVTFYYQFISFGLRWSPQYQVAGNIRSGKTGKNERAETRSRSGNNTSYI